ncbi:MAG: hypothetical protein JNN15_02075, partial [Blastocatellia bacterium]|nr:hypothetical protein [Blastocatellia bacterium]
KISAVFYTETTFSNITNAPSWVGALNDGKLRIPVGGLDSVNDELSRTITHELTHSFIRFKAQGRCPTWLNEGIAQIMEGRTSSKDRLAKAESLVSLKMLEGSFMNFSTSTASVAYSYSLFATEVLAERGNTTLMKILEDLGQNIGIDAALSRNTRYKNLEDLENEMKRRLSQ